MNRSRRLLLTGFLLLSRYGMEQPIAENDTPEGRQKNRRVQFKIVEKTDAQKTTVPE
jgi:hypothetical protein